jgi:hypothetical protein
MNDFDQAYSVFGDTSSDALKVVLTRQDEDEVEEAGVR